MASERPGGSRRSIPAPPGGKEELRATVLKPYLLRLRDERGDAAARALLVTVGLPLNVLEDETVWISVAAARRALAALATALGEAAIADPGAWTTHPETLGAWVSLLRVASTPLEAYRYLTAHASESTRVGTYVLNELGRERLLITYTPRPEDAEGQVDTRLCLVRAAELASVPRIWGLGPAEVQRTTCLASGDDRCTYSVRWRPASKPTWMAFAALAGATLSGGAVAVSRDDTATVIAASVGSVLGAAVGRLLARVSEERAQRTFEKHRIGALERGLELRGQSQRLPGDLTGTLLGGKYRILRRIGSGGIGAVYAAEHVALRAEVAVKVLRGAAAADASEIARLRREAQVQVSIEHPNVVRTLDLDQLPDGSLYVVMELLRGVSLAEHLRTRGPLSPASARRVFVQVCWALDAAHRLGVIHRDLKPANIFLCDDQTTKVLDFGMSKFAEAETLTQAGYTLGTPEYMSPEQCIGAPVEPRSDLYALGVVMYEALAGRLPIAARNRRDLLDLQQHARPTPLSEARPELSLPPVFEAAIMSCLGKRAAERPVSAGALGRTLEGVPPESLAEATREPAVVARTQA